MSREPSIIIGAAIAVLGALLAVLVAFGFDLTDEQVAGILGLATAVGSLLGAILIRGQVYAPDTVRQLRENHAKTVEHLLEQPAPPALAVVQVFDAGGRIEPGVHDVVNRTGHAEQIIPSDEHDHEAGRALLAEDDDEGERDAEEGLEP